MAKFRAPEGILSITLAQGDVSVVDGVVEIHQPTAGDVAALRLAGFTLVAAGSYFALPAEDPDHDL